MAPHGLQGLLRVGEDLGADLGPVDERLTGPGDPDELPASFRMAHEGPPLGRVDVTGKDRADPFAGDVVDRDQDVLRSVFGKPTVFGGVAIPPHVVSASAAAIVRHVRDARPEIAANVDELLDDAEAAPAPR